MHMARAQPVWNSLQNSMHGMHAPQAGRPAGRQAEPGGSAAHRRWP